MKIKICGHWFDLLETKLVMAEDKFGVSRYRYLTIEILDDMPESIKCETIIHEVLHQIAIAHDLTLNPEETIISTFATQLLQFLKDNPTLAMRLISNLPPAVS